MQQFSRLSMPVLKASVLEVDEIAVSLYSNGNPLLRFNSIGEGVHGLVSIESMVKYNPKMTEIVRQI